MLAHWSLSIRYVLIFKQLHSLRKSSLIKSQLKPQTVGLASRSRGRKGESLPSVLFFLVQNY